MSTAGCERGLCTQNKGKLDILMRLPTDAEGQSMANFDIGEACLHGKQQRAGAYLDLKVHVQCSCNQPSQALVVHTCIFRVE